MRTLGRWWGRRRRMTKVGIVVAVVFVALVMTTSSNTSSQPGSTAASQAVGGEVANATGSASPGPPTQTVPATTAPTVKPSVVATPTHASATIAGYGALDADWERTHTQDPRCCMGHAYDPDPSLGFDIQHDDRYYAVQHEDGRVLEYSMRLASGTTLEEAKAIALLQFPHDAHIVWDTPRDTCEQMEVQSLTLGHALADPKIDDSQGMVYVGLETEHIDGSWSRDPNNINDLMFAMIVMPKPDPSFGC